MLNFFSSFEPSPILIDFGLLKIHWYGLFMVLAMVAALLMSFRVAKLYNINRDIIFDVSFWLIVGGLLGARVYEIIIMLPFYIANPLQAVRIWEGGLAIHGGIIAGIIIIYFFAKKNNLSFWKLGATLVPGVALGQAIGRWGNYFNQELFGLPTNLPWKIPISVVNRPLQFISETHFHPTFLYESLGSLIIAIFLYSATIMGIKKKKIGPNFFLWSVCSYVILYSLLRFSLEFIRLDQTPLVFGWRWPQIASLLLIAGSSLLLFYKSNATKS